MLIITVAVNAPAGQAIGIKEQIAQDLERYGDTRVLSIEEQRSEYQQMEIEETVMARKGTCRGCGAEILWIGMPGGKSMPCDPEQVMYWEKPGADGKVVTPNGEVHSCLFEGDPAKATGLGYISHFGTCPEADRFRRKK